MVAAASFGILMGLGTLFSYGGYSIINSMTGNNSSASNTTNDNIIRPNQSNILNNGTLVPLNISKNINTKKDSKDFHERKKIQKNNMHEYKEQDEVGILQGRELNFEEKYYINEIDNNPEEYFTAQVENQISTNISDNNKLDTDDQIYQRHEFDYTESPEGLNVNNNKNKMLKSEKEENQNMFNFEPFPSLERTFDNEQNINNIPDNPLYKTPYDIEYKENVPVKNPLYPIPEERKFHLNEIDSQSYEKINPKLTLNINKKMYSNEDEIFNNEINSVEHNLKSNVNIPEEEILINEDLAGDISNPSIVNLFDALVSKKKSDELEIEILSEIEEDELIIKSLLSHTEGSGENMVKTLFASYVEIAGIVVASVLIVIGLIFLSIRQGMKYRRHNKIQRRYAENEIGRVNTLDYAYNSNDE